MNPTAKQRPTRLDVKLSEIEVGIADLCRQHGVSGEAVSRYAEILTDGGELPPIVVFEGEDGVLRLSAGRHRYEAMLQAGMTHTNAMVYKGDEYACLCFGASDNIMNGVPVSRDDRSSAAAAIIQMAMDQEEEVTNAELAEAVGLSVRHVQRIRAEHREPATPPPAEAPQTGTESPKPEEPAEAAQEAPETPAPKPTKKAQKEIAKKLEAGDHKWWPNGSKEGTFNAALKIGAKELRTTADQLAALAVKHPELVNFSKEATITKLRTTAKMLEDARLVEKRGDSYVPYWQAKQEANA